MYNVVFSKKAIKSLAKIPKEYQLRIKETARRLARNPFTLDLKKLSPPFDATYRLRIGSYRLFLHIDTEAKTVVIAEVIRRTTHTYR